MSDVQYNDNQNNDKTTSKLRFFIINWITLEFDKRQFISIEPGESAKHPGEYYAEQDPTQTTSLQSGQTPDPYIAVGMNITPTNWVLEHEYRPYKGWKHWLRTIAILLLLLLLTVSGIAYAISLAYR